MLSFISRSGLQPGQDTAPWRESMGSWTLAHLQRAHHEAQRREERALLELFWVGKEVKPINEGLLYEMYIYVILYYMKIHIIIYTF